MKNLTFHSFEGDSFLAYRICKNYISVLNGILLGNWEVEVPIALDYSLLSYNTLCGRWLLMFVQIRCLKSHTENEFLDNTH
jgi:hypothetical protein